jgi:hypothetical protein
MNEPEEKHVQCHFVNHKSHMKLPGKKISPQHLYVNLRKSVNAAPDILAGTGYQIQ